MKRDLTKDLTVFLVSCGNNPNYSFCLEALKQQTVEVTIDIIKDYHPMSVAFQEMLTRCKTRLYIEVDEDMVLDPYAIELMYEKILREPHTTAMCCFKLKDVHLDMEIYGVKIYKYDVFIKYPYDLSHISCEVEQLERIMKDGYTYTTELEVVGSHSPKWTDELIFERYLNIMEKFKEFKYVWMEKVPEQLYNKVKNDPTDENIYALLGAYTSVMHKDKIITGEKDIEKKNLGYMRMKSFTNFPVRGTLHLTNKCNYNCKFCYRNNNKVEEFPDMSLDVVSDLLYRFPTIKALCLCGFGEPFMCANLRDIIRLLRDRNVYSGLITNGSLLKANFENIRDIQPNYISISLNAPNKELHEQITGTKAFDTVLEGISMCVSEGIETYVSYVCTTENIEHIPEFLDLVKQIGVRGAHLHNLLPHFDELQNKDFWSLALTTDHSEVLKNWSNLKNSDVILKYPVLLEKGLIRRNCTLPWKHLDINGNGSISICSSVYPPNRDNGSMKDNLIWQNPYCQDFRESILGDQKDACKKCFRNAIYE
jgi:MoaA/NifB/PqqE/SkfB family radical SAM enzyme